MIDREQLAEALARLDPRDREVLDYSLRRHVPDEDLSSVFGLEPNEVARLRAAAVDHLSNQMGVERGEDLGQVLRLLLEPATWELLPEPPAGHGPVGVVDGPPPEAPEPPAPEEPEASEEPEEPEPPEAAAEPPPADPPAAEEPDDATLADKDHEPVLGMLADREAEEPAQRRPRGRRVLAGVAVAVAVLAPAGMVAALTDGDGGDTTAESSGSEGTRPFRPQAQAVGDPFPSEIKTANRYPVVHLRRSVNLLDAPGGKLKTRIGRKTEFGTRRVLGVVKRRGDWLAVLVPELDNGQIGWLREDKVAGVDTVAWSMHVDLSRRKLVVRRDGKTRRTVRIGVGRSDHPTPTGRFAVTDKLRVRAPGSPYGCCVLALTGHQTKLPPGWPGGDRLAVHATRDTSGLGKAVSLGCMRSHPRDAQWLLKTIPLGAPVFVRS